MNIICLLFKHHWVVEKKVFYCKRCGVIPPTTKKSGDFAPDRYKPNKADVYNYGDGTIDLN